MTEYTSDNECDNCRHEGTKTRRFECDSQFSRGIERIERHFCEVCSSTHLSAAVNYPSQCSDVKLYQSIGWIANEILSRLPRIAA